MSIRALMNSGMHRLLIPLIAVSSVGALASEQATGTTTNPDANSTTTAPVAWVYVSYAPDIKSSNAHKVAAFKAWANGTMTVMNGSPFNDDVGSMAVNGKYLIATAPHISRHIKWKAEAH